MHTNSLSQANQNKVEKVLKGSKDKNLSNSQPFTKQACPLYGTLRSFKHLLGISFKDILVQKETRTDNKKCLLTLTKLLETEAF